MANVQTYEEFVSTGMKKLGDVNSAGIRKVGPHIPAPGRPGRTKPGFNPPKPKPKPTKVPVFSGDKLNG